MLAGEQGRALEPEVHLQVARQALQRVRAVVARAPAHLLESDDARAAVSYDVLDPPGVAAAVGADEGMDVVGEETGHRADLSLRMAEANPLRAAA